MTYSELIKTFCDMFDVDGEHVENVLQETLIKKGIYQTPREYYENALKHKDTIMH